MTVEGGVFMTVQPLLEARIFAYDFLRRAFLQEPSQEFLMNLGPKQMTPAFPFREEHPDIAAGTKKVHEYLQQRDILSETEYEKLQRDYTRLFIGPGKLPAPPWESSYRNKDKLLFQEETRQVRMAYLKYALLSSLFQQEADDHVGLECDFMYQLAAVTREKAQTGDRAALREVLQDQADFLGQHLLPWIPAFAANVVSHAGTEFYQGMGEILRGFVQVDKEALQELLEIEW